MPKVPQNLKDIQSLVEIVATLRGPQGCPWDLEQTHLSLARYAIEESHEMVEALEEREALRSKPENTNSFSLATAKFKDELGDVLFQVILHAQLAAEENAFTLHDVIENINQKLVRRHPHVFAEVKVRGTSDVFANWEAIKKEEKKARGETAPYIAAPSTLPALQRASIIGEKTHKIKFDWETPQEVWLKVEEEVAELQEAMDNDVMSEIEHELGDVLFSLAQLARHYELDPEQVLRKANSRFLQRFEKMMAIFDDHSRKSAPASTSMDELLKSFSKLSTEEKEKFWQECKKNEVS